MTNTLVCVAIVVDENGNILLVKRGKEPFLHKWSLISGVGYAMDGLSIEEGVSIEVVGDVTALPRKVKKLFEKRENDQELVVFEVEVCKNDVQIQLPHITDIKWLDFSEISQQEDLAFQHQDILHSYFESFSGQGA